MDNEVGSPCFLQGNKSDFVGSECCFPRGNRIWKKSETRQSRIKSTVKYVVPLCFLSGKQKRYCLCWMFSFLAVNLRHVCSRQVFWERLLYGVPMLICTHECNTHANQNNEIIDKCRVYRFLCMSWPHEDNFVRNRKKWNKGMTITWRILVNNETLFFFIRVHVRSQSCPPVRWTHGLGRVGSGRVVSGHGFTGFWRVGSGPVSTLDF